VAGLEGSCRKRPEPDQNISKPADDAPLAFQIALDAPRDGWPHHRLAGCGIAVDRLAPPPAGGGAAADHAQKEEGGTNLHGTRPP